MKHIQILLLVSSGILLVSTSSAIAETKADSKTESTFSNGTEITVSESKTKVKDSSGSLKTVTEQVNTVDPVGIMNKTSDSVHTESVVKKNGERLDEVTSVNKNGTTVKYTSDVEIDRNKQGGDTTTITSKESINPKGMLNETSAEVKKQVERDETGLVVSETTTKKIDGKEVSEKTVPGAEK